MTKEDTVSLYFDFLCKTESWWGRGSFDDWGVDEYLETFNDTDLNLMFVGYLVALDIKLNQLTPLDQLQDDCITTEYNKRFGEK